MSDRTMERRQRGFTLIEILVVMFIAALMVTVLGLRLKAGGVKTLDEEVRRVKQLVYLASEQALLQGRDVGMTVEDNSYRFYLFDLTQQQWLSLDTERIFRSRQLPNKMTMELTIEESSVTWPEQEEDEFSLELSTGEGDDTDGNRTTPTTPAPQILMLSSGEITPFDLFFEMENVDTAIQLHFDIDGSDEIIRHEYGL